MFEKVKGPSMAEVGGGGGGGKRCQGEDGEEVRGLIRQGLWGPARSLS